MNLLPVVNKLCFNLNSYGKWDFSVVGSELWNELPQNVELSSTIEMTHDSPFYLSL